MARISLLACFVAWSLTAADSGRELLDAASKGSTSAVQALLAKGADVEAKDKNGRTPLMLAAQHGHGAVVSMLLERGASSTAKDQGGATAWTLAMFAPSGSRAGVDETLRLLPPPARPKLAVEAGWSAANLYSSCTVRPDQLTQNVGEIHTDALALAAFRRVFATGGKELVQIDAANARGAIKVPDEEAFTQSDAVLVMLVRPAVSCPAQQNADNVGLTIEVQLLRSKDRSVVWHKTYGGGIKGLHVRTVSYPQYLPVFDELVKSHVEAIYWGAVEALYRVQ